MKAYVLKDRNGKYISNKGYLSEDVPNISEAKFYENSSDIKAYRDELNMYEPDREWKVVFVNIEEVAEVW